MFHNLFRFSYVTSLSVPVYYIVYHLSFPFHRRGNVEKDVYKEMKRTKQPSYAQNLAGGGNGMGGGVPVESGTNNEYGQVEIERMINRQQRGNREHSEKQQAEAAVHHHFEESLKLAQQQRVSFFN